MSLNQTNKFENRLCISPCSIVNQSIGVTNQQFLNFLF